MYAAAIPSTRMAMRSANRIRHFASLAPLPPSPQAPRIYRYAIDVHGQLFLHDTRPKNLTSCFKNRDFLNFFFARIRPNDVEASGSAGATLEEDWPERADLTLDDALAYGRAQGYHWLSPCQGEHNVIRAADSPIVFRELSEDGTLTWAGTLTTPFEPDKLRVDAENGYLYHPSPTPPLSSLRKRTVHPYGAYSLLSSSLVLQRLADGLEIDTEQHETAGSIVWRDTTYELFALRKDDVTRSRRYRVDDLAGVQ